MIDTNWWNNRLRLLALSVGACGVHHQQKTDSSLLEWSLPCRQDAIDRAFNWNKCKKLRLITLPIVVVVVIIFSCVRFICQRLNQLTCCILSKSRQGRWGRCNRCLDCRRRVGETAQWNTLAGGLIDRFWSSYWLWWWLFVWWWCWLCKLRWCNSDDCCCCCTIVGLSQAANTPPVNDEATAAALAADDTDVDDEILIFSMPRSASTNGVVERKMCPRCGLSASSGGDVRKFTGANKWGWLCDKWWWWWCRWTPLLLFCCSNKCRTWEIWNNRGENSF